MPGIVLARFPLGEVSATVAVLVPELGVIRARAQGVRRSGAKLAGALTTLSESSLTIVSGAEGWRITGALLNVQWSRHLSPGARKAAARIVGLLLRLSPGEAHGQALFGIARAFLEALAVLSPDDYEPAEALAALRILSSYGLDAGDIPGDAYAFAPEALSKIREGWPSYITRINRGIAASGL